MKMRFFRQIRRLFYFMVKRSVSGISQILTLDSCCQELSSSNLQLPLLIFSQQKCSIFFTFIQRDVLLDSLHCGGDVQPSEARRRELAGVDVGDLGHGGVDAVHVFSLHHQDGLGRVEVELHTNTQPLKSLTGAVFVSRLWRSVCV